MTDPETPSPAQGGSSSLSSDGYGAALFAVLFLVLAGAFVFTGLRTMYTYNSLRDGIVGGDAYNYIILAQRGVGLIASGVAAAVVGCAIAVLSLRSKLPLS